MKARWRSQQRFSIVPVKTLELREVMTRRHSSSENETNQCQKRGQHEKALGLHKAENTANPSGKKCRERETWITLLGRHGWSPGWIFRSSGCQLSYEVKLQMKWASYPRALGLPDAIIPRYCCFFRNIFLCLFHKVQNWRPVTQPNINNQQ